MEFTFKHKRNRKSIVQEASISQVRERFLVLVGFAAAGLFASPSISWQEAPIYLAAMGVLLSLVNGGLLLLRPKWRTIAKEERRPYILGSFGIALALTFVAAVSAEGEVEAYLVLFGGGAVIYLVNRFNRWLMKDSAETKEDSLFV